MSDVRDAAAEAAGLDTFPRLLMHHARQRPTRPAMREKEYGIWQTYTWAEVAERVRAIASGLAELGFKRGDRLAVVGDNRPRLYWSVAACQCLGGIPVMMYQDAVAQEMAYVMADAEIRFACVEDQEQVDKMLEVKDGLPLLEHVIYDDPRGLRHYNQTFLHGLDEVLEMGRIHDSHHPDFLGNEIDKGSPDDVSVMLYTSGTTGKPKGVCQSHAAFIAAARGGCSFDKLTDRDDILSYLPMAWVGDHLFSYAQALVAGFTINCPESGETVMGDLREIGPTYYFAPPRVFENLLTQVMIRMEDASRIKRGLFGHFMDVAKRCGADILDGKPVSSGDRLQYWLGNALIYGPLKNVLGLSRVRVAYTAGAAIGPDLFRFYRSIGINLKQLYGQTETCAYVCLQPDGQIKLDSVGTPAPNVEVKLADGSVYPRKGKLLFSDTRVSGNTGTVEDIGLRSTKLRLVDRSLVIIPNKTVAAEAITNLSRFTARRVEQVDLRQLGVGQFDEQRFLPLLGDTRRLRQLGHRLLDHGLGLDRRLRVQQHRLHRRRLGGRLAQLLQRLLTVAGGLTLSFQMPGPTAEACGKSLQEAGEKARPQGRAS